LRIESNRLLVALIPIFPKRLHEYYAFTSETLEIALPRRPVIEKGERSVNPLFASEFPDFFLRQFFARPGESRSAICLFPLLFEDRLT